MMNENNPVCQRFYLIIQICLLVMFFLFFGFGKINSSATNTDFCLSNKDTKLILVDVTSKFDKRSKELLQHGFSKILKNFQEGERVIVSTIEESFTASKTLYDECIPHCQESGLLGSCTEGFLIMENRKQKQLLGNALYDGLNATSDLPASDIIRSIYFGTIAHQKKSSSLHVYIFSDLIENSDFISGKEFFGNSIEGLISRIVKHDLMPNFSNSTIRIFGIGRGGTLTRKPLEPILLKRVRDFWGLFFKKSGASNFEIAESYFDD